MFSFVVRNENIAETFEFDADPLKGFELSIAKTVKFLKDNESTKTFEYKMDDGDKWVEMKMKLIDKDRDSIKNMIHDSFIQAFKAFFPSDTDYPQFIDNAFNRVRIHA